MKKIILIMEPDEDLLDMYSETLVDAGFDVVGTRNRDEVLQVLRLSRADVVLMDIGNSVKSCILLLNAVRLGSSNKQAKFFLMSSEPLEDENKFLGIGVVKIFQKPIILDEIIRLFSTDNPEKV